MRTIHPAFSWQQVHDYMDLLGEPVELTPRYNVAPGQQVAAVRTSGGRPAHFPCCAGVCCRPGQRTRTWVIRMINARAETVARKPAFRAAYRSRRCLIPADGFFEWVRQGTVRQPWLVGLTDGRLMVFAGLWERWRVPENTALPRSLQNAAPGRRHRNLHRADHAGQRGDEAHSPPHARHPARRGIRALA